MQSPEYQAFVNEDRFDCCSAIHEMWLDCMYGSLVGSLVRYTDVEYSSISLLLGVELDTLLEDWNVRPSRSNGNVSRRLGMPDVTVMTEG
jgi:hypothetical protein